MTFLWESEEEATVFTKKFEPITTCNIFFAIKSVHDVNMNIMKIKNATFLLILIYIFKLCRFMYIILLLL